MKRRPHRTPSHFSAPATQRHVPRNQDHASCEPHVKTHSPPDPVPGCPTPFPSPANIVVHPIKFHPRLQPRVGLQHICLALAPPHSQPPIFFNLQNRPDFLTGETRATPHPGAPPFSPHVQDSLPLQLQRSPPASGHHHSTTPQLPVVVVFEFKNSSAPSSLHANPQSYPPLHHSPHRCVHQVAPHRGQKVVNCDQP